VFNSGVQTPPAGPAQGKGGRGGPSPQPTSDALPKLHGPVLLLNGGEPDFLMGASAATFEAINHVPAFYGACPRAPGVNKTKANSSAAGTTGCRPTLARRIVVCSFVLISVTSLVLFLSIALPMWDATAFELFIFTSPKMLVAAGRFDRPAHLRTPWPASRVID
jgi:hypothetical protein